jgi:uncharacterized NAD(P)/FAD-binding protein YdhS
MSNKKIAIIGGGLSGTMVALLLARRADKPQVILVEKNPEMLGRGVAYHTDFTHQPLNVVAGGMSIFPDQPGDFVEWLNNNRFRYSHLLTEISAKSFVPRKIFGDYVLEHLQKNQHDAAGHFQIRIDQALSVSDVDGKKQVDLESGVRLSVDEVVLALGNFPPADLFDLADPVNKDPRYFANPWTDRVYSHINGDENILLVGSGLTAVDVVLGLHVRGFEGKITMLSRRGRLPLAHDLSHPPFPIEKPVHSHPKETFLWLRKLIRDNKNIPWPSIIDGLRIHTQAIWQKWSNDEKKYFLKKLRPFWEVARHRIPKPSADILDKLMKENRLSVMSGEIVKANSGKDGIEVKFKSEKNIHEEVFQKVINCTGPESNYRKVRFPIIASLMDQGKVVNDELGLGISCTMDGNLVNSSGQIEKGLWCIGPMRKAVLWETTALREIREQAAALAVSLC